MAGRDDASGMAAWCARGQEKPRLKAGLKSGTNELRGS
jgi:hypothetical protein